TVTGTGDISGSSVSDNNPANYFGASPDIHIVKYVNGDDANTAAGVHVAAGSSLTFTYDVTTTANEALVSDMVTDDVQDANTAATAVHVAVGSTLTFTYDVTTTGNVPVSNVLVTDNVLGSITGFYTSGDDGDGLLESGETWHYSTTTIAVAGLHTNVGTVNGNDSFTGQPVSDNNPAN